MASHKKHSANMDLQAGNIRENKAMNSVLSVEYIDSAVDEDEAEYESCYNFSTKSSSNPLERGKYYKQTYRKAWEMMPDFKGWLTGIEGEPLRAYCLYCQKSLHAHRLSLLKHTCTIRHQKAAELHRFQKMKLKVPHYLATKKRKEIMDIEEGGANMTDDVETEEEEEEEEEEDNEEAPEEIENADYAEDVTPGEDQEALEIAVGGSSQGIYEEKPKYNNSITLKNYAKITMTSKLASIADSTANKSTTNNNPSTAATVTCIHSTPISTHVLDTSRGRPVAGLQVSLYRLINGRWTYVNEGVTNSDGRCSRLLDRSEFQIGRYKLHFDVDKYFEAQKVSTLYPFIEIVFDCKEDGDNVNYHIPLLLNPYGYTTYRGS